jgi:hypothetical protein
MRITLAVVFGIAALLLPGTAAASPPGNDNFANATVVDVASLPFSDSLSIIEAGYEGGENGYCGVSNTVWYTLTPTSDAVVRVNPSGSSFYGAVLNAYRQNGSGLGGLNHLTCATFGGSLTFTAQAGNTYHIQAGSSYYGAGTLQLTVSTVQPPANDNFASATTIGSLPFAT